MLKIRSKPIAFLLTLCLLLAFPIMSYAGTTQYGLDGWNKEHKDGEWVSGNLKGYAEGDNVPYRMTVEGFKRTGESIIITLDHQDAKGPLGFDGASDWFIGPIVEKGVDVDSITPDFQAGSGSDTFSVSGPNETLDSDGKTKLLEYTLTPNDTSTGSAFLAALESLYPDSKGNAGNWAIYWKAHLSVTDGTILGSGFWPGASLHIHTSRTGSKDVPLAVPPKPEIPMIDLQKSVDPGTIRAGGTVTYTFTVTNLGALDLKNVEVNDPMLGMTHNVGNMKAGDVVTFTQVFTVPSASPAGIYTNVAEVTGVSNGDQEVSDTATADLTVTVPQPGINIEKTGTPGAVITGSSVLYTITVTNTGEVTLTGITVDDPKIPVLNGTIPPSLAPGASFSLTGSAIPTEFPFVNTATADSDQTTSDTASFTVNEIIPRYGIEITKVANKELAVNGETIIYTIRITNSGDHKLNVSLSDNKITTWGGVVPNNLKLEAGEYVEITGAAVATNFPWVNVATATSNHTDAVTASATVNERPAYAIDIQKSGDKRLANPGETVVYTLTVTNNGTAPLTGITVNDPKIATLNGTIPESLAPGASFTLTGSAVMNQLPFDNTATADSNQTGPDTATWTVGLKPAYAISITKTPSPTTMTEPGGTFVYSFVVQNNGNQPVELTAVYDNTLGIITLPSVTTIEAGASSTAMTASAIHTAIGSYTNIVTATAQSIETREPVIVTATASATVTVTSSGGGGGGGGGGDEEITTVTPEPTPLAPITPTEEPVVLVEEATPLAALPQTGETDPLIFLGLGALLALAGYRLTRKAEEKQ